MERFTKNCRGFQKREEPQETFLLFSPPEFCHLPPDAGPCFGYIPRYFYNPKSDKCEKFIYGGCRGNQNNFKTFKSCHYTCVEKPGTCPRPPAGIDTICPLRCLSDWSCPGKKKCCPYGCKVDCMNPK
ncbi:kunitz-type serine protease inhibitor PPTI-like [Anolis carolinensis]|uniref:kunitz-type serine protease inhibitor PPTI-like n=1 Tax=Anolis carolinensis TaxID=28377 RepID=UPI002F2B6A3B